MPTPSVIQSTSRRLVGCGSCGRFCAVPLRHPTPCSSPTTPSCWRTSSTSVGPDVAGDLLHRSSLLSERVVASADEDRADVGELGGACLAKLSAVAGLL